MPDTVDTRRNSLGSFELEIAAHRLLATLCILRPMPGRVGGFRFHRGGR